MFFTTPAFADFKNDLPADFPVQTPTKMDEKNTPSTSHKKNTPTKKSSVQTTPTQSPQNNKQGSFDSELGNHDNNAPVFFSGNQGKGSRKTGIFNLVGDAVIIQDDTTLKSNLAQIFSLPGTLPTPGTSRIQRALATGNVRIFKKTTVSAPEIKATGDETEFLVPDRILILKGKAKVWRTNEYLNGDVIKINLNSGDIDIIRPEGTVDPKSANSGFHDKLDTNNPSPTKSASSNSK